MGKNQILTKEQKIILDEISRNNFLLKNFYFTGDTALSTFYLNHRFSEDLDFFSENRIDTQIILTLLHEWSNKYHFEIDSKPGEVVHIFNLSFPNKENLKVDFGYYPYKRLEKGKNFQGIEIDSLLDIATNKLVTVNMRSNVKDFVDLYFLLKKYTIWDLIEGKRIKFRMKTEPLLIAADFLKVNRFEDMPRMVKQLTLSQLKDFFREKAKVLGKTVTK